ncbi:MAG: DMT family transporter [Burkholderiaceae bacterium]|nr:DMT family transporter [Burkholderiaceae bacterium]
MTSTLWFTPVFILIWSTGFIIARYGMPYSEPMTFLAIRFGAVVLCMLPIVLWLKAPWPRGRQVWHIAIAGALFQFGYLGGVWVAVKMGMPAGLAALIIGLQPILTGLLASFVSERVSPRQWLGLILGLTGVALVLFTNIRLEGLSLASTLFAFVGMFAITFGTLYQKRFCPTFDLRTGSVIQFSISTLLCTIMMFIFETREIQWTVPMIGAMLWGTLAISIGAMSLWFVLLRRGDATKVSSMMYLVPPTTAIMAWVLFDEPLTPIVLVGIFITMMGVLIINQASWPNWLRRRS